jgi:hypothetical protein
MGCELCTSYAGGAGILLLTKGKLTIGKVKSSHCRRVLFLIFLHCRFQGVGQGKKQTFDCQQYPLLQAHMDRCDADNRRIKNCSVTKHQAGIKGMR